MDGGIIKLESYHICGGRKLKGSINIQGAKNAALPILAATVAVGGENYIDNCPKISDVFKMIEILNELGCKCKMQEKVVCVNSNDLSTWHISEKSMKVMRSSIFLTGAILGRLGRVELAQPGGCNIGKRPIDLHLMGLEKLGAKIQQDDNRIVCSTNGLKGAIIELDFPSVGATENLILAAINADGETHIKNCAREPEIIDLSNYLNKCGAKVYGAGSNYIRVEGKKKMRGTLHRIISDRIEAGTFIAAVAAAGGSIELKSAEAKNMISVITAFRRMGCEIIANDDKNELNVNVNNRTKSISLSTAPYPGFPTDMQSQLVAALVKADGVSEIEENIFENRFNYIKYLKRMGANIDILGRSAIINGVCSLNGNRVKAQDLRGGSALTIAGLAANGVTFVDDVYHIERGYEDFHKKLKYLGADIELLKE